MTAVHHTRVLDWRTLRPVILSSADAASVELRELIALVSDPDNDRDDIRRTYPRSLARVTEAAKAWIELMEAAA